MALERMLAGLSTRRYPVGLEPVGGQLDEKSSATSKSAVSRNVAALPDRLGVLIPKRADHSPIVTLGVINVIRYQSPLRPKILHKLVTGESARADVAVGADARRRRPPHPVPRRAAQVRIAGHQRGRDVEVAQRLLGHKTAVLTLDRYGHLFPDDHAAVADAFDCAADALRTATGLKPVAVAQK